LELETIDLRLEKEGSRHLENFDVHDFLQQDFETLEEKAKAFAFHLRNAHIKAGAIMREICGPVSKYTKVKNPRTQKIESLFMLGSNNYLDLAQEPFIQERMIEAIKEFGVGCGGPQLLNGNTSYHVALQNKLSSMKGAEHTILFSSGYSANVGWPTALLSKDDWLVYDVQSHGSLYDSMKMGEFSSLPFAHNDLEHLEKRLWNIRQKNPRSTIIVCVEGVYSMDGDIAPLDQIRRIALEYKALLCVDDAHGHGVLGKFGHGTQEHFGLEGKIDLVMGTFSKAYCVTGAFVSGPRDFIDFMRVNARSHLFSASLPPASIAAVLGAIEFVEKNPERVSRLRFNTQLLAGLLREAGLKAKSESAIIPVFIPSSIDILDLIVDLHEEGIFCNGIQYPSVPKNRQRLRLSMMATFTEEEIKSIAKKIILVCQKRGVI